MKTKIALGLVCVLILTVLSSLALVQATVVPTPAPSPYGFVYTTADGGAYCINFIVGQNVHINWLAGPVGTTVQITVTFQDNTPFALANSNGINVGQSSFNGQIYFTPNKPGIYTVHLLGAYGSEETVQITTATVFVVPESALGSIMAIGAGLGAFIVVKKRSSFVR